MIKILTDEEFDNVAGAVYSGEPCDWELLKDAIRELYERRINSGQPWK